MDSLFSQGIIGIATGIVTSAILLLIKTLWDKNLYPFLQELKYQGVKIDGKWVGKLIDPSNNERSDFKLFVTQSALNLSGHFNLKHTGQNNSFDVDFIAQGKIWEGYMILNLTPMDRRITSYATSLMKIGGGGGALLGRLTYRNVNNEQVDSVIVSLSREQKVA